MGKIRPVGDFHEYRIQQRHIAHYRDSGKCVYHWFVHEEIVDGEECHHVYGRGRDKDSWRESWESLMYLCRECHSHQPPLSRRNTGAYIETLLHFANQTPINPMFSREDFS